MEHTEQLTAAAERYREQAVEMDAARLALTDAVRAAYATGARKADILRAIDHVWSREWLDRVLEVSRSSEVDQAGEPPHSAA